MGSTRQVVPCRDVTSQVEFGLLCFRTSANVLHVPVNEYGYFWYACMQTVRAAWWLVTRFRQSLSHCPTGRMFTTTVRMAAAAVCSWTTRSVSFATSITTAPDVATTADHATTFTATTRVLPTEVVFALMAGRKSSAIKVRVTDSAVIIRF